MSTLMFSQTCVCGRMFTDLGGFTRHEKGCCKGKKRLFNALNKAKEVYQAKRARLSLSRGPTANSDQETISSCSKDKLREGRDDSVGNEQAIQQAWYHDAPITFPNTVPFRASPPHVCTGMRNHISTPAKSTMLLFARKYVCIIF
jgi:hypothetical protein